MNIQRYFLEMHTKDDINPLECGLAGISIEENDKRDPQYCKFLYKKIGEEYHWKDRLAWSMEQWGDYLNQEKLKFFVAKKGEDPVGFYEYLNHKDKKEVEITYMGIFKEYFGKKVGGYLLTHALRESWNHKPSRVWVHTCTLDHPNALRNYIARGMNVFRKEKVTI